MRWNEIKASLQEQKLAKGQSAAIPGGISTGVPPVPTGPVNAYYKYRLGVSMAGSPAYHHDYDVHGGELVDDMVIIQYSAADEEISQTALKKAGYKTKKISSRGSQEPDDTSTTSPVAQWNKTK